MSEPVTGEVIDYAGFSKRDNLLRIGVANGHATGGMFLLAAENFPAGVTLDGVPAESLVAVVAFLTRGPRVLATVYDPDRGTAGLGFVGCSRIALTTAIDI